MSKSFLFLANGFEETEALATADVLRRGGVELELVSISKWREVTSAHGMTVVADSLLSEMQGEEIDYMIFPGGMPGAKNLSECSVLTEMLKRHFQAKKPIAAICAAPALVLGQLPLDKNIRMTCYPGFEKFLPGINVLVEGVVTDGNIITARGPAYAYSFGLEILKHIKSKEVAEEVAEGLLL